MSGNERLRGAHVDMHDGTGLPNSDHDGQLVEYPHEASRFDAGNGQGTVSGPPLDGGVLEHPILDGSTQRPAAEADVPNPYRGVDDPATIAKQPALNDAGSGRWLAAGVFATVVVTVPLLLLIPFDPIWSIIGITFALVALACMLIARLSHLRQRLRLRLMAVLTWLMLLVPVIIISTLLIVHADEIW